MGKREFVNFDEESFPPPKAIHLKYAFGLPNLGSICPTKEIIQNLVPDY